MDTQIEIYQGSDGQTQIEVKFDQETVWLNQRQIAALFGKDSDTIVCTWEISSKNKSWKKI